MFKRFFFVTILGLIAGCYSTYYDVSLSTGTKILRGTWTGEAILNCQTSIESVIWNADATKLAGILNGAIRVWQPETATELSSFSTQHLNSFYFSPNGDELLVQRNTNNNFSLERYNTTTGELTSSQMMPEVIQTLSANLERGASIQNKTLRIWNTTNGTPVLELPLTDTWISANPDLKLKLNADGSRVAYFDNTGFTVLNVATSSIIFSQVPASDIRWYLSEMEFRDDILVFRNSERNKNTFILIQAGIWQWNTTTQALQRFMPISQRILAGANFAVAESFNGFTVWDLRNGQQTISRPQKVTNISPNATRGLTDISDGLFCGQQILNINTNIQEARISVSTPEKLVFTTTMTPTFKTEGMYLVNATANLGTRQLEISGEVARLCERGSKPFESVCQRFTTQTPALRPPPPIYMLENSVKIGQFYHNFTTNQQLNGTINFNDGKLYRFTLQQTP